MGVFQKQRQQVGKWDRKQGTDHNLNAALHAFSSSQDKNEMWMAWWHGSILLGKIALNLSD